VKRRPTFSVQLCTYITTHLCMQVARHGRTAHSVARNVCKSDQNVPKLFNINWMKIGPKTKITLRPTLICLGFFPKWWNFNQSGRTYGKFVVNGIRKTCRQQFSRHPVKKKVFYASMKFWVRTWITFPVCKKCKQKNFSQFSRNYKKYLLPGYESYHLHLPTKNRP
jgi:hypothetical protein